MIAIYSAIVGKTILGSMRWGSGRFKIAAGVILQPHMKTGRRAPMRGAGGEEQSGIESAVERSGHAERQRIFSAIRQKADPKEPEDQHGPRTGLRDSGNICELERIRIRRDGEAGNLTTVTIGEGKVAIAISHGLATGCLHAICDKTGYRRSQEGRITKRRVDYDGVEIVERSPKK